MDPLILDALNAAALRPDGVTRDDEIVVDDVLEEMEAEREEEDRRLDDPRHGQARDINRRIE